MNEIMVELHEFINRIIILSGNQLSWLYVSSVVLLLVVQQVVLRIHINRLNLNDLKKQNTTELLMNFTSSDWLKIYSQLFFGIIDVLVANFCFGENLISSEVFMAIVFFNFINLFFDIIIIVFDSLRYVGLIKLLFSSIPLALVILFFPPFYENKIVAIIIIAIHVYRIIWWIGDDLSHIRFMRNYKLQMQSTTDYDRERLNKISSQIERSNKNKDMSILNLLISCIWLTVPELWFAIVVAIFWVMRGTIGYSRSSGINAIDNRATFISELKNGNTYNFLILSFVIYLFLGINSQAVLLIGLLNELILIFTFKKSKLSNNITVVNVSNNYSISIFEKIGSVLVVKMNPDTSLNGVNFVNLFNKKNQKSFGVLNNICSIYETNSEITNYVEIRKKSRNFILILNPDSSDRIHRIEDDFRYALNNLITVIDGYEIKDLGKIDSISICIEPEEFNLAYLRISLYSKLCDESFEVLDSGVDVYMNKPRDLLSAELLKIHDKISTEAILINLKIQEMFSIQDSDRLKSLEGKGLFEFNNMLRQVHETPSIPLRFIQCIMIWANLDKMLNTDDGPISARINKFWKSKYNDYVGMELLKKLMLNYGWKSKINSEPTLKQLFSYMNFVRNKTRGHGIPSKIHFDFYFVLEKLSIFLVHSIKELNFNLFVSLNPNDLQLNQTGETDFQSKLKSKTIFSTLGINDIWIVKLSSGGCPNIYPYQTDYKYNTSYFPYSETSKFVNEYINMKSVFEIFGSEKCNILLTFEENNVLHQYKLDSFFRSKSGVIFSYHGKKKGIKSFISYTTGALIKPSIEREYENLL
ncbi:MAG: hypothetical protein LW704_10080 [Cryomorphaceae bacterium]|nr:hypothetical protein [Cryomorphaceae bacterium]